MLPLEMLKVWQCLTRWVTNCQCKPCNAHFMYNLLANDNFYVHVHALLLFLFMVSICEIELWKGLIVARARYKT